MAWAPSALASALAPSSVLASAARTSFGAVAACSSVFFFFSAPVNSGSFDRASWSSVTSASAISWSTCFGPSEKSVASGGALSGTASDGFGVAGAGGGLSPWSGVTALSLAAAVSGGALVVVSIALADSSLPEATLPWTAPFTASALPDSPNLSASSRFFGAWAAMASLTARMNPALSNVPGLAACIFSAFAALPWAILSSAGGLAAPWALAASAAGGRWAVTVFCFERTSDFSRANFGSPWGPRREPAAPSAPPSPPPSARRCTTRGRPPEGGAPPLRGVPPDGGPFSGAPDGASAARAWTG